MCRGPAVHAGSRPVLPDVIGRVFIGTIAALKVGSALYLLGAPSLVCLLAASAIVLYIAVASTLLR